MLKSPPNPTGTRVSRASIQTQSTRHKPNKSLQSAFPRGTPFDHQKLTKLGVSSALAHNYLNSGCPQTEDGQSDFTTFWMEPVSVFGSLHLTMLAAVHLGCRSTRKFSHSAFGAVRSAGVFRSNAHTNSDVIRLPKTVCHCQWFCQ